MKTIFLALVVLVAAISHGECGECPSVGTIKDLDYKRFVNGLWFSMQETSPPRLPCLHYNISFDASGNFDITFLPYHVPLQALRKDPDDVSKGFTMNINFPALNGATFNLIDTDYDNWALIFNCKEADPVAKTERFYSATFWGRSRNMDPAHLEHMKDICKANNIEYGTIQKMIQPEALCRVAETLFGPALGFFISKLG